MAYHRTDIILAEILQDCKTTEGFLDAVFGFLRRNTDFYDAPQNNMEKIAFARSIRERLVFNALQRFDPDPSLLRLAAGNAVNGAPPAVAEVEIETSDQPVATNTLIEPSQQTVSTSTSSSVAELRSCFAASEYKNGACFDNYCWSQTLREVELHVKLPPELQSAKSLKVQIQPHKICVRSKLNPEHVVLCGRLRQFKHNEAVWTIAGPILLISLDKVKEQWWEKLFASEQPIDTEKIDSECYIDELPESSQVAIHKLCLGQQAQGSQTDSQMSTNEPDMLERLSKAWDAEGSPFRGQPFDPSVVRFS